MRVVLSLVVCALIVPAWAMKEDLYPSPEDVAEKICAVVAEYRAVRSAQLSKQVIKQPLITLLNDLYNAHHSPHNTMLNVAEASVSEESILVEETDVLSEKLVDPELSWPLIKEAFLKEDKPIFCRVVSELFNRLQQEKREQMDAVIKSYNKKRVIALKLLITALLQTIGVLVLDIYCLSSWW